MVLRARHALVQWSLYYGVSLTPRPMTAAVAYSDDVSCCVRILCVGDHVEQLIQIRDQLDPDFDFVIVGCSSEALSALATEPQFDLIINDCEMSGAGGERFLERLRSHSPDAERLILTPRNDESARAMAASDARVMRLLRRKCRSSVLRGAVADALLRHRARTLRAQAIPRVTPMGGNPCCVLRAGPG